MALESIYNTLHSLAKPELIVTRDMNDYPATARCSACGKGMPIRQKWINSSADNLAWFANQFRLHVEQMHPDWKLNSELVGDSL